MVVGKRKMMSMTRKRRRMGRLLDPVLPVVPTLVVPPPTRVVPTPQSGAELEEEKEDGKADKVRTEREP